MTRLRCSREVRPWETQFRKKSLGSKAEYYFTFTMPGGFQVPSPGGKMEGGSIFGQ